MARDISELDDSESGQKRPVSGDNSGNNGLIDRRSYLKLAGAATAAVAASGAVGASDEEYDVIEADNSNYILDDGEVFENKIIDFSNGNWFTIVADATNWTIRNVGFRGTHNHDHNAIVALDDGGNTSTIENVYLGDGCVRPSSYSSHGQVGIFVHRDHSGHLDIRNVYLEDWPNNGIYASPAAYDTPGTVRIENCFGKNNYVASMRVSDGGEVVDCVAYNDGTGRYVGRPFWGWGDQEVVGCDFDGGPYGNGASIFGRDGSNTYVEDTRHSGYSMSGSGSYSEGSGVENGSADLSVPEGVPTSPEEAVSGTAGSTGGTSEPDTDDSRGDHEDLQHTYEFVAEDEDEPTDYYFEIEAGPIEPSTYNDATIEEELMWISDDGTRAAGRVADGRHAWEFDTNLIDVTVEGPAEPVVNDVESHLERYPLEGATGDDWKGDMPWHDTDYEHTILIDGVGTAGGTRYEFTVSGAVEKSNEHGATIDEADVIDSGTVTGSVAGWRDAFLFDGDLEELTVDGNARVYVDGEEVDPADYGAELPHVLTIVGDGSPASYEVSVDGTVDRMPGDDATDSTIAESTLEGSIERDVQRFRFSGAISDITLIDGDARVYVDEERVDPDEIGETELLPHAVVIDGTDTDGESTYSFDIDGDVIASNYRDASADEDDVIEGTSVTGSVGDGLDAYWFDGDIVDFQLAGDATVDVEYNVHSQ
ncbi:hypothetical protein RBH26_16335 [Natronolimnohabitans sp. A-GB9]|uniref:hypothetical protein n=1 Tax=Natronolimnohabitans sp. A-GB9 TaxID=3069757 RepID=UPI0027B8376B|nr:hypothetical protein [Natronolimnohabitans sp. A-GB9]MDQ2052046.1 hypothetical protein [Natronolimnohabitans sp. A-GB9]